MAITDKEVHEVAVLGLGSLGHGIAQTFAVAGCRVCGFGTDTATRRRVRSNLVRMADAHLLSPTAVGDTLARITVADTEREAVGGAQFVVEAVAEDLAIKQELLERVETVVGRDAILASNSSTYPISQSGARLAHPGRAVVTHWFNPPHLVPTAEIVGGPRTDDGTIDTTLVLHRRIGKLAVRINGERPGFLVNRVQMALIREVWSLLEEGAASAVDIDAAIRGSIGFRLATIGPLEVCDFGGVDIWRMVYQNLVGEIRSDTTIPTIVDRLVADGKLGAKTVKGFHDYVGGLIPEKRDARDTRMMALTRLFDQGDD